jgi:hypothetical protein
MTYTIGSSPRWKDGPAPDGPKQLPDPTYVRTNIPENAERLAMRSVCLNIDPYIIACGTRQSASSRVGGLHNEQHCAMEGWACARWAQAITRSYVRLHAHKCDNWPEEEPPLALSKMCVCLNIGPYTMAYGHSSPAAHWVQCP